MKYLLILISAIGLFGCKGADEKIPAYIYIKPFALTTTAEQGSASSSITEGWVYINQEFIGAYSLPATVPFLSDGQTRITIFPGVHENGLAEFPNIYDFYQQFEVNKVVTPAKVDTLAPSTTYYPNTAFASVENFEASNSFTYKTASVGGKMILSNVGALEGKSCGLIKLQAKDTIYATSAGSVNVMKNVLNNGSPSYVELNYSSDVDIEVGMNGIDKNSGQEVYQSIAFFKGKKEWRKIYVNLRNVIFDNRYSAYRLVLSASLPIANGKVSQDAGEARFDNIKVVYR